MADGFQETFNSIIAERGGLAVFNTVSLACARALAAALNAPGASPTVIGNLAALLPAPIQPGEQSYDLRILSVGELRELDYLLGRAADAREARPPRVRRSRREEEALALAQFVDAVARKAKPLTDGEATRIRTHIWFLLSKVISPDELYSYLAGSRPGRPAAVAAQQTATSMPEVVEPVREAAAPVENVISLARPRSIYGGGPVADHSREPWRNDGVRRGFFGDNNR